MGQNPAYRPSDAVLSPLQPHAIPCAQRIGPIRAFENNLQTNLPFIYLLTPIRADESMRYLAFF